MGLQKVEGILPIKLTFETASQTASRSYKAKSGGAADGALVVAEPLLRARVVLHAYSDCNVVSMSRSGRRVRSLRQVRLENAGLGRVGAIGAKRCTVPVAR